MFKVAQRTNSHGLMRQKRRTPGDHLSPNGLESRRVKMAMQIKEQGNMHIWSLWLSFLILGVYSVCTYRIQYVPWLIGDTGGDNPAELTNGAPGLRGPRPTLGAKPVSSRTSSPATRAARKLANQCRVASSPSASPRNAAKQPTDTDSHLDTQGPPQRTTAATQHRHPRDSNSVCFNHPITFLAGRLDSLEFHFAMLDDQP